MRTSSWAPSWRGSCQPSWLSSSSWSMSVWCIDDLAILVTGLFMAGMSPHEPDWCQLMSLMAPRHSLMTLIGPTLQKLRLWALLVPFHTFWSFAKFFMLMNEAYFIIYEIWKTFILFSNINLKVAALWPLGSFYYSHHQMWLLSKFTHAGLSKKLDTELSGNGRKWAELELFSRVWK